MCVWGGGGGEVFNEHIYTPAYSVVIFVSVAMPIQEDLVMSMSTLSTSDKDSSTSAAEGELQEKHL